MLFDNQGDGSFVSIGCGSLTGDHGHFTGCAWSDYDNDGDLDLFVSTVAGEKNALYRNRGNDNRWLIVRLKGTSSNAAGIGARVTALAILEGRVVRQLRQVGVGGLDDLRAHFGLGNAPRVMRLRIEWPSGTVQEFSSVGVNQILTVVEPRRPVLDVRWPVGEPFELAITGDPDAVYRVGGSDDLVPWEILGTATSATGQSTFSDPQAAEHRHRFYKAQRVEP